MLHCGRRPLAAGILERALERFRERPAAAIGPGIGRCCYEVDERARVEFRDLDGVASGRMLDLRAIVRRKLKAGGVTRIEDVDLCTSCRNDLFFSHRRDGEATGREAGIAWLTSVGNTPPMSRENVEIVKRINEAYARGDRAAARELLDPEIEVEYRGQLIDKDATYHGHAGVGQLMESIVENFDDFQVEVEEYIDHAEHVVVALHQRALGKHSGVPVDIHIGQVWTLRDGKAVRWRIYRTKEEALAAVGL